jgi:MFS family permease
MSIMLVEYGSVRTESLEALSQIHTIIQYGLASLGVSVGLGLVTAHNNTITGAIVLMGLSPTIIIFGVIMMAVAVHRVIQTRQYLRLLEARIAQLPVESRYAAPRWERMRAQHDQAAVNGYPFAIVASIGAAIGFGPVLGGLLLATHGHWTGFAVGEFLDLSAIAIFGARSHRTYRRLVKLNQSELAVIRNEDEHPPGPN